MLGYAEDVPSEAFLAERSSFEMSVAKRERRNYGTCNHGDRRNGRWYYIHL